MRGGLTAEEYRAYIFLEVKLEATGHVIPPK
jgi:hypothetical protein